MNLPDCACAELHRSAGLPSCVDQPPNATPGTYMSRRSGSHPVDNLDAEHSAHVGDRYRPHYFARRLAHASTDSSYAVPPPAPCPCPQLTRVSSSLKPHTPSLRHMGEMQLRNVAKISPCGARPRTRALSQLSLESPVVLPCQASRFLAPCRNHAARHQR